VSDEDTKSEDNTSTADSRTTHRRLVAMAIEELKPWMVRMIENAQRLLPLLTLAGELSDRKTAADILRAAVVLQHAYLEDFLRTVVATLLPLGAESSLNGIPLAGLDKPHVTFSLGQLARHRGKTVEDVLVESVREELGRTTYNSVGEIEAVLRRLGCKIEDHRDSFPEIGRMIKRRHDIVHRADRVKAPDSDEYILQPIEASQVEKWMESSTAFMVSLWVPLFEKRTS
jgi:hypothetical protein